MLDFFYQSMCFRPPSQPGKTAQALASQNSNGQTIDNGIVASFLSAICEQNFITELRPSRLIGMYTLAISVINVKRAHVLCYIVLMLNLFKTVTTILYKNLYKNLGCKCTPLFYCIYRIGHYFER